MAIKIILLLLLPLAAILVHVTAAAIPAGMKKPAAADGGKVHKMFFRHRVIPPYLGGGTGLFPGGGSSGCGAGVGSGGPGGTWQFFRGVRAAGDASHALKGVYNGGEAVAADVKIGVAFPMP